MSNKILVYGGIFAFFWGICSLVLFFLVPGESSFQIVKFVRLYAFSICYICIIAPLWWHFVLINFQALWWALFFHILLIFGSHIFIYFVLVLYKISISPHVNLQQLFAVQCSLAFLFFSLAFLLCQFKISTIWSSLSAALLGFIAMSTLFWSDVLLALSKTYRSEIITGILYSNPLVAISICFPNLDYLRSGVFYEVCPIVNYAFHYPLWYILCVSYFVVGGIFQVLGFYLGKKAHV